MAQGGLLGQTAGLYDSPCIGKAYQPQLEILFECLEGCQPKARVGAGPGYTVPLDPAAVGAAHRKGRHRVEGKGTGHQAAVRQLVRKREPVGEDGDVVAEVGLQHQRPFGPAVGKARTGYGGDRGINAPGGLGLEVPGVVQQPGFELGPVPVGVFRGDEPFLQVLLVERAGSGIHRQRNRAVGLPGIGGAANPGQVVRHAPLEVQAGPQLPLVIGIEGDAVLLVGPFVQVQPGIIGRHGAVESVESVQGIVHIGDVGRHAVARNQVLGVVVHRHLLGAFGIQHGVHHEFMPIVGIVGTVAVMEDLRQGAERETQVGAVVEGRHQAHVPAGFGNFFFHGDGDNPVALLFGLLFFFGTER